MQPIPAPEILPTQISLRQTVQNLELRCRILEIEHRSASLKSEEYRKLLEERCTAGHQAGHAAAVEAPAPAPSEAAPVPELVRRDRDTEPGPERAFVGIIARLCARNGTNNRTAIFRAAGLRDRKLGREEAACASATPEISWLEFCQLFGGVFFTERPMGNRVPGYGSDTAHFLCTNARTQPFAPTCIGGPGVILSSPDAPTLVSKQFHVFADPLLDGRRSKLKYCGMYTTVNAPMEVQVDEWHALPTKCTGRMLKNLQRSKLRDLHARCALRLRKGLFSDPSPAEILEWTRQSQGRGPHSEVLGPRAIQDAFNAGVEKYRFEVIKCIGYDMNLARIIQENHRAQ